MSFDNSGFLVRDKNAEVHNVLLALDITEAVIDEAIEINCELIVSHHPFIWNPLRSVTVEQLTTRKLIKLIKNDISVISMHTNLDIADGGVNDVLIDLLGAECCGKLDGDNCGRTGILPNEMELNDFLVFCRERLNSKGLRYVDGGKKVKHLAVMGGAGGDAMVDAIAKGCDTYVTADIKYHQFLEAKEFSVHSQVISFI